MAVERLAAAKAQLVVVLHLIEYGWRPRRIIGIDTLRKAERSVKDGLAEIERQLGPHSIELVPFLNTLGGIQWRIGVMDANAQFTEIRRALGKRVQEIEIFDEPGAPWSRLKRLLASSLTFDEILEEDSKSIDRILSEAEEASWKLVIREEQETEPARDGRLACVERCEKTIGVLFLGLFTIPFLIGGGWSFLSCS
jgi:hypothetical protein